MVRVHIPAPLRTLTHGEADLAAQGETLEGVINDLEERYAGLKARLVEGERIRPGMAVFINAVNVPSRLSTKVPANAEIYFAPAITGG